MDWYGSIWFDLFFFSYCLELDSVAGIDYDLWNFGCREELYHIFPLLFGEKKWLEPLIVSKLQQFFSLSKWFSRKFLRGISVMESIPSEFLS